MTLYTVRVFKSLISQPTVTWVNSYELNSGEAPFDHPTMGIHAENLVSFEETFHLSNTRFDRVVFSTYQADSTPYNPDNLAVFPRDDEGDIILVGQEREALDTVLWIRRQPMFGRAGRAFYRHCLVDSDIDTNSGQLSLTTAGSARLALLWPIAMAYLGETFPYMVMAGNSLLETYYPATSAGEEQVPVKTYTASPHIRSVVDLIVAGARRVQRNNRYFDKE